MSDGSRLRQSWYAAINNAETQFRHLLNSTNWKRLSSEQAKWKSLPDQSNVVVHRRDDLLKLALDLSMQSDGLEPWKAVLSTPELRQEWDPAVEEAHLLELVDPHVRICKTKFTLGWPANPRDAVTISRMYHDSTTLIDITTSLPRSPDEPAFLRPSPPYVRSHVTLFAWCIQRLHLDSHSPKLRITCYWQHDLKSLWSSSVSSPALHQQLSTMVLGLFKCVLKRGTRVPRLLSFGEGIAVERLRYQIDRQALTVDYALVPVENGLEQKRAMLSIVEYVLPSMEGWDLQLSTKASSDEVERLQWTVQASRKVETTNTDAMGMVVLKVTHEPLRGDHEVLKVRLVLEVSSASRGIRLNGVLQRVEDEVEQARKADNKTQDGEEGMLRDVESATGVSMISTSSAATASSVTSAVSDGSGTTTVAGSSSLGTGVVTVPGRPGRTLAAEKSVLSRVRRNYIYFSSLLQEPEAKWRQTMDARGVAITQLDSIDPTLVVYRAEATFLGVGLWDLYSVVVSVAARGHWDKTHDDVVLLEDINGLTELWHNKTKPAWPANGRDAVLLRTVYKSPTSIHVFAFSADADPHLFPNNQIPSADPNVIRTQVDLQGWAIESLSPTTTLLTLLDQSDMKGWTGKTSIPNQMIAYVAGIGEFAIKCGGPPVVTRLSGARKSSEKLDWERSSFRVVYEALRPAEIKSRSVAVSTSTGSGESTPAKQRGSELVAGSENEMIECEIRCDVDTWAASLDIVVDPPPQGISCLRRHKLSPEGGGLWLTLTHDPVYPTTGSIFISRRKRSTKSSISIGSPSEFSPTNASFNVGDNEVEEEGRFRVIVRRAPGKEKGLVMVNGTRIEVDIEDMPESEVKSALKQKRIKPIRVPLDQPPVFNVVRKRRAEWGDDAGEEGEVEKSGSSRTASTSRERSGEVMSATREWATAPKPAGTLTRWWSYAVQRASVASAVVPISTASVAGGRPESAMPSKQKWPMQYALEALVWVMEEYAEDRLGANMVVVGRTRNSSGDGTASITPTPSVSITTPDGWTFVGEKAGLGVYRKLIPEVSPVIPVHRGTKIIEGVSAEELAGAILHGSCRKEWDGWYDSNRVFESFGWGCETGFTVLKGTFPFKSRGFYLSRVMARPAPANGSSSISAALSHVGRSQSTGGRSIRGPGSLLRRSTGIGTASSERKRKNGPGPIFIVSASYSGDSESISRFSSHKYNEYGLPIGRVFVDGWVLETLDPYDTREIDVTIPSTRCTRVVAMDLKGNVPATVNGLVNVGIVRALSGLGDWVGQRLKGKTEVGGKSVPLKDSVGMGIAVPSVRLPGGNTLLKEVRGGLEGLDRRGVAWSVRLKDGKRVLVKERFGVDERTYRCMLLVSVASVLDGDANEKEKEEQVTRASSRAKSPKSPSPSPQPGRTEWNSSGQDAGDGGNDAGDETAQTSRSAPNTLRGRPLVSPWPRRGLKQPVNMLVAELVIDSKLYPVGYDINIWSKMRSEEKIVLGGAKGDSKCIPLKDIVVKTTGIAGMATTTVTSSDPALSPSIPDASDASQERVLPLGCTVHAMPSSPMHSSPMRHLVKVTLPTAQYSPQIVEDPLTGEKRSPPEKPNWLLEMEEGGSAVVEIEVKARQEKSSKTNGVLVRFNDVDAHVENEKESLTSLGREELMNDRLSKMPVLSMMPNEAEALPEMLRVPLAIADDLLDPAAMKSNTTAGTTESKLAETAISETGEVARTASITGNAACGPGQANPGGRLLGFLQSYPNPLTRFSGGSMSNNGNSQTSPGSSTGSTTSNLTASPESNTAGQKLPGGFADMDTAAAMTPRMYPLSMIAIVALIAFLIGSLLRSLLSPADFIYVVKDIKDADDAGAGGGWREIRRLFEIKYAFGGWDFQIAAVRRR